MRRLLLFALALTTLNALACGKNSNSSDGGTTADAGPTGVDAGPADAGPMYVIEIDIDDHGLKALWSSPAPNLKRLIREGTLAYTHVDVPTHSNHNNMTLITGEWPEADNVPANSWLARQAKDGYPWSAWNQPFNLVGLGLGEYVYYGLNPLNDSPTGPAHHVESVYSTVNNAGLGTTAYVGQLPPFEMGATDVHFSVDGAKIYGLSIDGSLATTLLTGEFRYPASALADGGYITLDGPGNATGGPDGGPETLEHFTIRDAANVWQAAAAGNAPPRFMFVWAFIALDGDPTSTYGADSDELASVVTDYDDAIGDLLTAIENSPYKNQVNILFTLDHGKVDTSEQVELGGSGGDGEELSQQVNAHGSPEVTNLNYDLLNEDGDALIYAKVPDAGNAGGTVQQTAVTHKLVDIIQSGAIQGVDVTRTITWDGYRGTRRLHDYRIEGPNQADFIVFPQDGWTLGVVTGDGGSNFVGPFDTTVHPFPFGRHGGFSEDELYVPLIMWGPAFKQGVVLAHPVNHADVAPTAMKILGQEITTAEGGPILAAFRGDPAETLVDPSDMTTARPTVLTNSGFNGTATLKGTAANQVVVVDLAGVSYDEAFVDPITVAHLPHLATLASSGVNFEAAWNRYRTVAENRYDMLSGSVPVVDSSGNWMPTVESDPSQSGFPGQGLLLEPTTPAQAPNPDALTAWRGTATWATDSLVNAAEAAGFSAALIGNGQALASHFTINASDVMPTTDALASGQLSTFLGAHTKALAIVGLGQAGRTADRHSAAALAELDALDSALSALTTAAPNAMFIVTSSNGADIDDTASTFYGAQAARHVPLVIAGGPARSGVITGQPATSADVPATALFALGQAGETDFSEGTWIAGPPNADGVPQPIPSTATAGHVLAEAYNLQ